MKIIPILILGLTLSSCAFLNNQHKQSPQSSQVTQPSSPQSPSVVESNLPAKVESEETTSPKAPSIVKSKPLPPQPPKPHELNLVFSCDISCYGQEADKLNFRVDNYLTQFQGESSNIYFKVIQVVSEQQFLIEFFGGGNWYLLETKKPKDYATNQIVIGSFRFQMNGSFTYETKVKSTNTVRVIRTLE